MESSVPILDKGIVMMRAVMERLLESVLEVLGKHHFRIEKLDFPRNIKKRSIDIVAASNERKLLIKIISSIDDIHYREAKELHGISYTLNIPSIIVSEIFNRNPMEDYVLYDRHGLPAITPQTLESVLSGSEDIYVYYKRGEFYVNINREKLREIREEKRLSLGDIALALGVTRKAVYDYERAKMDINIDKAKKLVDMLGEEILEPINVFRTPKASIDNQPDHIAEARIINEALEKGYRIAHAVNTVFDTALDMYGTRYTIIVEHHRENKVLTKAEESEKLERIIEVRRAAIIQTPRLRREVERMGISIVEGLRDLEENT